MTVPAGAAAAGAGVKAPFGSLTTEICGASSEADSSVSLAQAPHIRAVISRENRNFQLFMSKEWLISKDEED